MEHKETGARGGLTGRSRVGGPARQVYASLVCLGVASALLPMRGTFAQGMRLSVDPHTMATGTKNPAAGDYPLSADSSAIVTVPPQCVGDTRCPLLVQLPGGGQPASVMTGWMAPVARKYGFLLLTISQGSYEPPQVTTTLKNVLQRFAVDPEKIGVAGRCASSGYGMSYGIENLDIFNRIISVSGGVPIDGMDPKNTTAQFLIDRGFREIPDNFRTADALRKAGHPVTVALAIREHEHQGEDYDYVGHWLMQSWTQPDPTKRAAPQVVANPLPTLTPDALTKMTTFWTNFSKEPESVRLAGRRGFLHEVSLPAGQQSAVVWITDMPAFAAKYPAVAADLTKAGLTAQQHDAYRVAILSAIVTTRGGRALGTLDSASTVAKNIAFLKANHPALKALGSAGIDDPSRAAEIGGCCTNPEQVDKMGPLGIWRTP